MVVTIQQEFPSELVDYRYIPGADLGILEWWGCMTNVREARMKNFYATPTLLRLHPLYCPGGQQLETTVPSSNPPSRSAPAYKYVCHEQLQQHGDLC